MASFTEQATLRVIDQSTAQINKINAALRKLFATAKSLRSITVNIKVRATGIDKALAGLRKLNVAARKSQIGPVIAAHTRAARQFGRTVGVAANQATVGIGKVSKAQQQQNQHTASAIAQQKTLQQQQRRTQSGVPSIPQRRPAQPWGPPRPPPPPPPRQPPTAPGPHFGGGGYRRTPGGAFLGGIGGGLGMGLGRINDSFGLVAIAGYAAARALQAVATAGYERDRAQLAVDTQTSEAQREVFKQLDAEAKARGDLPPALRYKKDQFDLARSSFQGDVGNDPRFKTAADLRSLEAQRERAVRADILARELFKNVVPGMYARKPSMTQPQAQEELLKLVQTLGITTDKMFETDKATGKQKFADSAQRVLDGINLAQRAAPDLTLSQIRTAAASIKSLGYTASPQQIAETLFNVSAKGQRAANEAYQMYRAGQGTVNIKKLNTAIEDLGGFIPGTAIRAPAKTTGGRKARKGKPGRKGKPTGPGLVETGSGIPIEFPSDEPGGEPITLATQPSEWWRRLFKEQQAITKLEKDIGTQAAGRLGAGATKAQKKAASDKAIADLRAQPEGAKPEQITDYVNRTLAGARNTALQGILDAWLGGDIAKAGIAQAAGTPGPEEVEKRMGESWAVSATNLSTAMSNAAASTAEYVASMIGLNKIMTGLGDLIQNNQLAAGAIAIGIGTAVAAAVIVPFATLTSAATALIGAAGAIKAAAMVPGLNVPGGKPGAGAARGAIGTGLAVAGGTVLPAIGWSLLAYELYQQIQPYLPTKDEQTDTARKVEVDKQKAVLAALEQAVAKQREIQGEPKTQPQKDRAAAQTQKVEELRTKIAELESGEAGKPKSVTTTAIGPDGMPKKALGAGPVPVEVVPTPGQKPASDIETKVKQAVEEHIRNQKRAAEAAKPAEAKPVAKAVADAKPVTKAVAEAKPAVAPTVPPGGAASLTASALTALIPQLAATSNSITLAVSGLATAGSSFASTFQTGAAAITNAGATAASTLSGAAPGIGASIGAAAAAVISAATANVNINVSGSVKSGADTGTQQP